jgi:hypothetical protein
MEGSPTVLGILEIRGLDNLVEAAAELSTALGNPNAKDLYSRVAYRAFGSFPGGGLAGDETIRVVMLSQGLATQTVVLLLPNMAGHPDYLSDWEQMGWVHVSETADGVRHFQNQQGPGLWGMNSVYALSYGDQLIIGASTTDIRQVERILSDLPPILPAEGVVVMQINYSVVADLLESALPAVFEKMSGAQSGAKMAEGMQSYFHWYLRLLKQLKTGVLGLGIADEHLNFHVRMEALPESTLAKWMASVQEPSEQMAAVNLPGAFWVQTLHAGEPRYLDESYFAMLRALSGMSPKEGNPEFYQNYLAFLKNVEELDDGHSGFAFFPPLPGEPIRFVHYIGLKDSTRFSHLIQQLPSFFTEAMVPSIAGGLEGEMPTFALDLDEPRQYQDIPIEALRLSIQLPETGDAPIPAGFPTNLQGEIAYLPTGAVFSIGESNLMNQVLDHLLDEKFTPVENLASWKAFFPSPEDNRFFVMHMDLFEAARSYSKFLGMLNVPDFSAYLPASPGSLDGYGYRENNAFMSRFRFRLADIAAFQKSLRQMAQPQRMAEPPPAANMNGPSMDAIPTSHTRQTPAAADLPDAMEEIEMEPLAKS